MQAIVGLFLLAVWIAGVVIAKGFWSTLIAFIIPFWAYYLVIEQLIFKFA
jgi:hypothetical protein